MRRLFADIIACALVLFAPPLIAAAGITALVFAVDGFFEAALWGLVADMLYAGHGAAFLPFRYPMTAFLLAVYLVSIPLKSALSFYPRA